MDEYDVDIQVFGKDTNATLNSDYEFATNYTKDELSNDTSIRGIGFQVIPWCADGYVHDADGICRETGNFSAETRRATEIIREQERTNKDWLSYINYYIGGNEYHDYTYDVDVVLLQEDSENGSNDEFYTIAE